MSAGHMVLVEPTSEERRGSLGATGRVMSIIERTSHHGPCYTPERAYERDLCETYYYDNLSSL